VEAWFQGVEPGHGENVIDPGGLRCRAKGRGWRTGLVPV
jgi:hypothetical protein